MSRQAARFVNRRVGRVLEDESEVERMLVAGAVVQRQGDHYWIVSGGESPAELAQLAATPASACE